MKKNNNTIKTTIGHAIKFLIAIFVFYATFQYTIPVYTNARAYVEEKVLNTTKILLIGDTPITIEVADTVYSRALGLSGRKSLAEGRGMFFVFEEEAKHGFWMRDMNFSIDIIWFNSSGKIIFIKENVAPSTYPNTFAPDSPALYALEVPAGFTKKKHIKLGDSIDFY